jgi:Sulfotransferase domain
MRQPDFFVVGAAKSGTTALWTFFQQHPDIFVTNEISHKELSYYSDEYGIDDNEKYLKYFRNAKDHQLIGEVCHTYLTSKISAEWIKREVPNAKIIILLRNPIDRAISLYNWMVMDGYEDLNSFEKALHREKLIAEGAYDTSKLLHKFHQNYNYFSSGLYYKQVKRYYDIFEKENILVIEYSDFRNNYEDKLKSIFEFLKVKNVSIPRTLNINKSKRVKFIKLQYWVRKISMSKFRNRPIVKRLISFNFKYNISNKAPKKMSKATRELLKKKYVDDINSLSRLTGINFNEKWFE